MVVHMLLLLVATAAAEQRLYAVGRQLRLANHSDDAAHVLRAVDYSPTSWGADSYLYEPNSGGMWSTLFQRDLTLMHAIGVNAVRRTEYGQRGPAAAHLPKLVAVLPPAADPPPV